MTGRVLLIEDEPNIAEAIRFLLSRDGWSVTWHADGIGAVEVVRDTGPDLLILDVMLPGRSGYDILEELRADPAFGALPVLMLTALGHARDRERAARLGVTLFMAKPFSNAEMVAAVRDLATAPPAPRAP